MENMTCAAIICSNLKTLMLGICDILSRGKKLEYVYEHMAIVRSLDVKNLPTISAEEDSLCFKL